MKLPLTYVVKGEDRKVDIYFKYFHNDVIIMSEVDSGSSLATAGQPKLRRKQYRVHYPWYYKLFFMSPRLIFISYQPLYI